MSTPRLNWSTSSAATSSRQTARTSSGPWREASSTTALRRFTVEGSNLRLRLPIDLEDAVLGAKVRVPTLGGTVEMAIPPMTSSGRTFRLRGRGLSDKTGAGDLLVTAEIKLPEGSDEALIEYARRRREAKVG